MEVHSTLKWGLLEAVYSESLSFELLSRGIGNTREQLLKCFYKQHELEKTKEVFVWPQGHMKTMLYGNPRACVHIILEFNPRCLCN